MLTAYAAPSRAPLRPPARVLAVAWAATLLVSRLPEIALREGLGLPAPWINAFWVAIAGALAAGGAAVGLLRPLRRYFLLVLGVLVLTLVADPALRGAVPPGSLPLTGVAAIDRLVVERVVLVAEALVLAGAAARLAGPAGPSYLAIGSLAAPAGRLLGREVRWTAVAPLTAVGLALLTAAAASALVPLTGDRVARAAPLLPPVLLAAALNALAEEVLYRAALLASLGAAVGAPHALWITALWFGLGHFYGGIPAGLPGVAAAGALGLLFGRAMIQTRGLAWPWCMHFAVDAAIYTFLALGVAAGS